MIDEEGTRWWRRLPDLAAKNPGIIYDFPASTHLSNLHKTFYL